MKNNFFVWYFGAGLAGLFRFWKRFIAFLFHFFSIAELFRTLLSPWKRDVSPKTWRGFNPLKTAERILMNLMARILGGIVRSCVIGIGLFVILIFNLFILAFLILWFTWPLAMIGLVISLISGNYLYGLPLLITVLFLPIVAYAYKQRLAPDYRGMSLVELSRYPWFKRVIERMGIDQSGITKEVLSDLTQFEQILKKVNISQEEFTTILDWEMSFQIKKENSGKFWLEENLNQMTPIGRSWKYAYTVHLDKFSYDLTVTDATDYKKIDLVGRQDEVSVIKLVLSRGDQNNVLLVGEAGLGKRSLIHYLAKNIRLGQEKDPVFADKRIILLDLGQAMAAAASEGHNIEDYLHRIFTEAAYAGNIIIGINDIQNYISSEPNSLRPDVSSILNDYLVLPNFQILATTSRKEYHRLIEGHESFMKYLEVVELDEISEEETIQVLFRKYSPVEKNQVVFTYPAFKEIVKDAKRFVSGAFPLPESALDLASEVLIHWQKNPSSHLITPETVQEFLTVKTGIPMGRIEREEKERLLNLEDILHQRVIGQDEAIRQVSETIRKLRSGITDANRPAGSFLFLGPTGVGKTETAKALAQTYYGDEERMVRIDMSEFQNPGSLDRLIGNEKMNLPGRLTTAVGDNPYSLILLDELEKAYPEILDIFLQVLDEGMLTDAFGNKINFRNNVIIATSNVGSHLIPKMLQEGKSVPEVKDAIIDYAISQGLYRVEFLNRFDDVIFFKPLADNELLSVVPLMLRKFIQRLQEEKNIEIEFDNSIYSYIIEQGYNPMFGARSINRFIADKIEDVIARKIIEGELQSGDKKVITVQDLK